MKANEAMRFAICIVVLSSCVVVSPSRRSAAATAAVTAPVAATAPVDEWSRRVEATSGLGHREALAALGDLRAELWTANETRRAAFQPDPSFPPEVKDRLKRNPPVQLSQAELSLMLRVHRLRARHFLELGDRESARREVFASVSATGVQVLTCQSADALCIDVRDRILSTQKVPLCVEGCRRQVLTSQGLLAAGLPPGEARAEPGFAWVVVSSVQPHDGGRWLVTGLDSTGSSYADCIGQYETDKVKEVTDSMIVVERTTWCRELQQKKVKPMRVQFLFEPTSKPQVGESVLVMVSGQVRRTVSAQREDVLFREVEVVQRRHKGTCDVANQSVSCRALAKLPYSM